MQNARNGMMVLAVSALLFGAGCATPETRQATAYKTLKSVQVAVDAALKVYGTATVTGRVTPEKQAEIEAKRSTYQVAFRLAVQAARNDLTVSPPADVQKLANELQLLISALPL